jgi:prevent-host-death family protein
MTEIGAFEAKNMLSALLDRVERGEEIVITRHGRPVARLVPNAGGIDRSQAHAAIQRIRTRVSEIKPQRFDWTLLKVDRDAGRP